MNTACPKQGCQLPCDGAWCSAISSSGAGALSKRMYVVILKLSFEEAAEF